jgi:hypothetical protein
MACSASSFARSCTRCVASHTKTNIVSKFASNDLTKAYPEQLNNMKLPSIAERAAVREAPEVTAAYASLSDVSTGLTSFEFIPAG